MSQLRSVSFASLCCSILIAACGSNSTTTDGGGTDAGNNNDAGSGDAGSDAGPRGDGGSAPGAPVLSFTTDAGGVQLTWTLPGAFGDERFQVLRSDQGSGFAQVTGASNVAADAYSDSVASALPGAGHAYEVTATNGNGTGPASNVVHVLQAPGDLAAGGSDTRVILVWGALENAASYDVYRVPAADAGGSATKLGNTTSAEFVDDGSASAITTGNSYSYQLIAQALDGGQPSTGSNIATAKASGVDVGAEITHVSDLDGGTVVAENSLIAPIIFTVDDAGTITQFPYFSSSSATVISGVPAGPYYLTTDFYYVFDTSSRAINLNTTVAGRSDAAQPLNLAGQTAMGYALTGLDVWVQTDGGADAGPSDSLESISQGAGNEVADLQTALVVDAGVIAAGATTFNGVELIDGSQNDLNLVDSTKGDVYYLNQLHLQHSGNGELYQTVTKSYVNSSLHMADGATAAIAGVMAAVVPTAITDLKVANSAFSAQQAAINPASTNAGQTVAISNEKDSALFGYYGTPATLFTATTDGSTSSDVDFGLAGFGNPFPASWEPFVYVTYGFNMAFDLAGDSGPATFEAVSGFYQQASSFNFGTGITPPLQPMANVKINGQNLFADQVNVGLTPTLSWSAVTGSATPVMYVVNLYELSLADDGTVAIGLSDYPPPYYPLQDWSFYTTATSMKLPAIVFTAETADASHWYFATIDAEVTASGATGVDKTISPFETGTSYQRVEVITNKFTPGPGTSPPSTYDLVHQALPRSSHYSSRGLVGPQPAPIASGARKPLSSF